MCNKKIALLIIALSAILSTRSQTLPDFSTIHLNAKTDYDSTANKAALQAADYVLSTPASRDNMNRLLAAKYLITWMSGTPDYNFSLDARAARFTKKDDNLLVVYMAGMARYSLENKAESSDAKKVAFNGASAVAAYCKNPDNKVKQTGEIKKLIEASDQGKLAAYLD